MRIISSFILFFFVAASINAFAQQNDSLEKVNKNAPVIVFDKETHDFGELNKGEDCSCVFTFTNKGKEPLILSNVKASCGCTVPTWSKEPVAKGKTGEIKVKYDSSRVGNFSKSITVNSNASTPVTVIHISGTIKAPEGEENKEQPAPQQH